MAQRGYLEGKVKFDGSVVDEGNSERKRRRVVNNAQRLEEATDCFGKLLVQSNEAQRELEERKMAFEERKMVSDEQMRLADREECQKKREEQRQGCKEDRETQNRMEMEMFKRFMDMMTEMRK